MQEAFPAAPRSVAVQSILFHTPRTSLDRMLEALDNSAFVGKTELLCDRLEVVLGDASSTRQLSDDDVEELRSSYSHIDQISYLFFGDNLGTAEGHNRLAPLSTADFLVTSNPDVVPDARALWRMVSIFEDPSVGMVEAKQLPVEHPKDYEDNTGITSWATTAFAMTPRSLFDELEGFDAQTFFMYCDDVDYSWRVREAGRTVVFASSAVVFHDKRLSLKGRWMPTSAERTYSAQAALLLAHKWSREDVVRRVLHDYDESQAEQQQAAAAEFRRRLHEGELVPQRDPDHVVGEFHGNHYAEHRFTL